MRLSDFQSPIDILSSPLLPFWSVLQFEIRYKQGKIGETQKAALTDTKKPRKPLDLRGFKDGGRDRG